MEQSLTDRGDGEKLIDTKLEGVHSTDSSQLLLTSYNLVASKPSAAVPAHELLLMGYNPVASKPLAAGLDPRAAAHEL